MTTDFHKPAVVLVTPQLGENIGKTARAMLNFALTDLRLVAPRDGWPNPDAGPSASGADEVLEGARVFETLDDALADCNRVYATTVRPRDMIKDVYTPAQAAEQAHVVAAGGGKVAFVFGPERSGLDNDAIARCDAILTAPVNPSFGSLNLAQAVVLVAYEHFQHAADMQFKPPPVMSAPKEQVAGMYEQMAGALRERGYFHPKERVHHMEKTLRNILERAAFSGQEIQTLRGALKYLTRPPKS